MNIEDHGLFASILKTAYMKHINESGSMTAAKVNEIPLPMGLVLYEKWIELTAKENI